MLDAWDNVAHVGTDLTRVTESYPRPVRPYRYGASPHKLRPHVATEYYDTREWWRATANRDVARREARQMEGVPPRTYPEIVNLPRDIRVDDIPPKVVTAFDALGFSDPLPEFLRAVGFLIVRMNEKH